MRCVSALVLLVLAALTAAKDTLDAPADLFNDKLNTVETKPSVRLDPYIRKALLKALTELEQHENFTAETEAEETDDSSATESVLLRTGEDNPSPTEASKEDVRIHSFVVNGQSAFGSATSAKPTVSSKKFSIISTTAGNVENHSALPTQTPFKEIFQARESGVNLQQVRSIASASKLDSENSIPKSTPSKPTSPVSTTTTTTTTTTPKPTHNHDGENIEEVDKRDVQVFQAPLVAAFTVHQDAQGKPKQVVPIYQQNAARGAALTTPTGVQPPATQNQQQNLNENKVHPVFISQQISLQRQLEEKQRILEEQLRLLQIQQRQQEELLRKQQFLLQQKEAQRQQQLQFEQEQLRRQQILSEQQRLQASQPVNNFQLPLQQFNNQNQFQQNNNQNQFQQNNNQNQFQQNNNQNQFQQLNNVVRPQNNQVQILQSLEQSDSLGNQQQLPNREAVDFLIHLRNQQKEQFPLQDNHLPQGISNFLQPGPVVPNLQQTNTFNQDPFRQGNRQSNRVFRQESGVGNFGFNNQQNYNRFNTFNPVQQTNRFHPFNRQNPFGHGAELQQLLVQNGGINGRAHEDLNIVTKVLSLNHGIPINNNISNRLPFDSRRHVRN